MTLLQYAAHQKLMHDVRIMPQWNTKANTVALLKF
jgi:hypothetical protein